MATEMSYHINKIEKGMFGEHTKITEEYLEFIDVIEQNNPILQLVELSDLLGAIEAYVKKYNITLNDLIYMKTLTNNSFISGKRK